MLLINRQSKRRLRDLSPEQLDIVQLVVAAQSLQAALDEYPGFDFDVLKPLRDLLKTGILTAA